MVRESSCRCDREVLLIHSSRSHSSFFFLVAHLAFIERIRFYNQRTDGSDLRIAILNHHFIGVTLVGIVAQATIAIL